MNAQLIRIVGSIKGIPYSQDKNVGNVPAPKRWTDAIIAQTKDLPKVCSPCILRITFKLPPDKFPKDHPYGNDLDNLLKRFCDALTDTILSNAPGKDGAIISLEAAKVKVASENEAGADFEIIEIQNKIT